MEHSESKKAVMFLLTMFSTAMAVFMLLANYLPLPDGLQQKLASASWLQTTVKIAGVAILSQIVFGAFARRVLWTASILGWLVIFGGQVTAYLLIPGIAPWVALAGYVWVFFAGMSYKGWLLGHLFSYWNDNWWTAIAACWGPVKNP